MNALVICGLGLAWLIFAYFVYGRFIARTLIAPDDTKDTPAYTLRDDVDYSPANPRFLWGHHFASIAGAGPIIGPIIALSIFGWGPIVLWIALGSVFIGAVHDYVALMLSVRNKGKGIAEIASSSIGKTAGVVFAILLYLTLLFIITVFAVSASQALVQKPTLVIPTYGVSLLALFLGVAVYRLNVNWKIASLVAVVIAYGLIAIGSACPLALPEAWTVPQKEMFFLTVNFVYCLIASMLPVWMLLQPRDFISSVQLFIGLALAVIGIIVLRPIMQAPEVTDNLWAGAKPLWPVLFITVACGAVSGFHTMVSTGTTSKQIAKESHGLLVGYGGMLAEGFLALVVLLMVGAGLKWGLAPEGASVIDARGYFQTALKQNWIIAFSEGFGNIVGGMGIPMLSATFAGLLGAAMVKTFVMTSLDTSTRLGRYIVTETLAPKSRFLNNRVVSTLIVLIPSYYLAVTNSYGNIWKMFGVSNQLIAAITLLVVSAYLARKKRTTLITLLPAVFMLLTTIGALLWDLFRSEGYIFNEKPNVLLAIISAGLFILALMIVISSVKTLLEMHRLKQDA